jgi:hypothetical protein
MNLRALNNRSAYDDFVGKGEVYQLPWADFLQRARTAHELFLRVDEAAEARRASFSDG